MALHVKHAIIITASGSRLSTGGISQRGEVCVEFAYHMRGDSMGRLEVRTSGGEEAVWERSGEQGDSWNTATVTANINSGDKVCDLSFHYFRKYCEKYALSVKTDLCIIYIDTKSGITSVQVKVKSLRPDTSGLLQLSAVSVSSYARCVV